MLANMIHKMIYDQSRILNYILVLTAAYFTHCGKSITEAVITAVPAPA